MTKKEYYKMLVLFKKLMKKERELTAEESQKLTTLAESLETWEDDNISMNYDWVKDVDTSDWL